MTQPRGSTDINTRILEAVAADKYTGWERFNDLLVRKRQGRTFNGVVLLVHGTFAADVADLGHRGQTNGQGRMDTVPNWWQVDSDFAQKLKSYGLEVIGFHWSGENSEHERLRAGKELLFKLLCLERLSIPYSVVCHSHGGNVAWNAFTELSRLTTRQQSTSLRHPFESKRNSEVIDAIWQGDQFDRHGRHTDLSRLPIPDCQAVANLPNLRNWVTVGTPFLIHKKNSSRTMMFVIFVWLLWVMVAVCSAIAIVATAQEVYLPDTIFGALLILGAAALAGTFRFLKQVRSAPCNETLNAEAWVQLKDRHCGLWSRHDEAINLLQGSLKCSSNLIPRLKVVSAKVSEAEIDLVDRLQMTFPYYAVDWLSLQIARCINAGVNFLVLPVVECFLKKRIKTISLGDDAPWHYCTDVTSHPSKHEPDSCLELVHPDLKFEQAISEMDSDLPQNIRSLVFECSVSGLATIGRIDADAASKLLVHNFYFKYEPTLSLIAGCAARGFKQPTGIDD